MSVFAPRVIAAGEACMQGRRPTMEDAHTVVTDAAKEAGVQGERPNMSVFVIFDGHAGSQCATIASGELWKEIIEMPKVATMTADANRNTTEEEKNCISDNIIRCVEDYDERLLTRCRKEGISDGCTMAGILVRDNDVFCFNSGDSRSVIGHWLLDSDASKISNTTTTTTAGEEEGKTIEKGTNEQTSTEKPKLVVISKALSEDHKPTIKRELHRIVQVGGRVAPTKMRIGSTGGLGGFGGGFGASIGGQSVEIPLGPDRVWPGGLALSRALGDLPFKDVSDPRDKTNNNENNSNDDKAENAGAKKEEEIRDLMGSGANTDNDIVVNSLKRFGISHKLVVPTPDITCSTLSDVENLEEDKVKSDVDTFLQSCSFLVVACDGLWDVMGSAEAAEYAASKIREEIENVLMVENKTNIMEIDLSSICQKVSQTIVQEAYYRNSQDNISCIVVLLRGQPEMQDAEPTPSEDGEAKSDDNAKEVKEGDKESDDKKQKKDEKMNPEEEEEDEDEMANGEPKEPHEAANSGDKLGKSIKLYGYFNATDPSEPSMLPAQAVIPSNVDDDPESWGIITFQYGMGFM